MKVKVVKKSRHRDENIEISSAYIKLDALLKFACIASSGGEAKVLIQDGLVSVNGTVCSQRGKKIYPGDVVLVDGRTLHVTSLGLDKDEG